MKEKGFFEKLKNKRQQKNQKTNKRKKFYNQKNINRSKYYCVNCSNSNTIDYSFKQNE